MNGMGKLLSRTLRVFAKNVHENAVNHGWWDEERSFGELIALCHSELSEALEEYRKGHQPDETYYSEGGEWWLHREIMVLKSRGSRESNGGEQK